jgi:hypothetical protein
MRFLALMALLLLAGLALAALPIDDRREAPAESRSEPTRPAGDDRRSARRPAVPRVLCPAGVPGCRSVRGRVMFVERVDPDGDGDLHVVVLDGSVTAPGVTAVDVRAGLRPARDPRVGDEVSAAGPVQPGSYGQKQIHALEFHAG